MKIIDTNLPINELAIVIKVMLASGKILTIKVSKEEFAYLNEQELKEFYDGLNYQKKEGN